MMSQATYGSMICALSVPLISVCFLTAVVPTDCSFAGSPPALINADGVKDGKKPKYTNLLIKETSPYLLMHAHNPVDWYPWGQKAFAKAKKEGKLVFLSIGYSSCYWCHVMERKCFENEKIAKLLNKYFVSIKVDREERPDIDKVYMTAYQVSSERGGGWPLSMFLLPDGRPLGGGTYIPPEPFTELLKRVAKLNKEEKAKLEKTGDLLAKFTKSNLEQSERAVRLGALDRTRVKACMDSLVSRFDSKYGGFGSPPDFAAPKFPTPCQLEFVFYEVNRAAKKRIDKEAKGQLKMLTLTLDKMALGGIYDQLGGGFHRYSTERTWTVPHFEKMLYDNGQLVEIYSKAYSLTQKPLYKRVVKETIEYLKREMLSSEGALYSSQDAETEEEEGRFYVWTENELRSAVPNEADRKFFRKVYGIEGEPNFEGKYYIFNLPQPLAETAKAMKLNEGNFRKRLDHLKAKLFEIRSRREKPFKNKIALTEWSGLMIAGLAQAGHTFDNEEYTKLAKRCAQFVLDKQITKNGRLLRRYGAAPGQKPKPGVDGYLSDYAGLIHGLLTLHDTTGEMRWLAQARELTKVVLKHHAAKRGGFYLVANDKAKLFARSQDQFDGAIPSGNSLMLRNLVRLWDKTKNEQYKQQIDKGFDAFWQTLRYRPSGMTTLTQALSLYLDAKDERPIADLLKG